MVQTEFALRAISNYLTFSIFHDSFSSLLGAKLVWFSDSTSFHFKLQTREKLLEKLFFRIKSPARLDE